MDRCRRWVFLYGGDPYVDAADRLCRGKAQAVYSQIARWQVMSSSPTALDLSRNGYDTVQIAAYFRITEAQALKQVTSQRSAMLGLPNPYKFNTPTKEAWPSGRLAYAGRD